MACLPFSFVDLPNANLLKRYPRHLANAVLVVDDEDLKNCRRWHLHHS
jgi:hypothetical protein